MTWSSSERSEVNVRGEANHTRTETESVVVVGLR